MRKRRGDLTLTVACVLRSGGVYTPDWVYKLKAGVAGHLSREHRFVCLSNIDVPGVDVVGLRHDYPRWWSKIELFEPGLLDGQVLYLDLDCIVTAQIDDIPVQTGFAMCQDFLRGAGFHNSSVMSWRGNYSKIYDAFRTQPDAVMHKYDKLRPHGRIGDQAFIEDVMKGEIRKFPTSQIVSYRAKAKSGPGDAAIVAFHGRPKPSQANGWAKNMWDGL